MVSKNFNNELKKGSGGLWSAVFQGMAFVGPAATAASFFVVEAAVVGASVSLTYMIAIVGVAAAMYMNYRFSQRIAHAGGYYAYIEAGIGKRTSLFGAWLYFFNLLGAVSGFVMLFFAGILWPLIPYLSANPYGWMPLILIPFTLMFVFLYKGIKPSLYYTMIGSIIEVGFLIIMSLIIILKVGNNNTLLPFTTSGHTFSEIGLATVFAILGYVGLGSMITISEEIRNPKVNIPRALFITIVIAFVVYALSSYALVVGWGISKIGSFATTSNPGFIVVEKYLGLGGYLIFIIITLNSFLSESIAQGNAFTRLGYAMARDRKLFPFSWSETHNKYGSPTKIIMFELPLSLIIAYIAGILWGPFMAATILTTVNGVSLYIVHIISNISLPIWGKMKLKSKFTDLLLMIFIPLIATIVYAFAIYGTFIPFPAYPLNSADYIIIAVILAGIMISFIFRKHQSNLTDFSLSEEK